MSGLNLMGGWDPHGFALPPEAPGPFKGSGRDYCYDTYRELYAQTGDRRYLELMLEYARDEPC